MSIENKDLPDAREQAVPRMEPTGALAQILTGLNTLLIAIGEAGKEAREEGYPAHIPPSDHYVAGGR